MKDWMKLIRSACILGQFGFNLIIPPVVMAMVGWWLQSRFGLGIWVMLVCLAVGLCTSGANAYRFYRKIIDADEKKAKNQRQSKPVNFYRHE